MVSGDPSGLDTQYMMALFAAQKQNQQSQQSILSEGVDQLRANIKQIVGPQNKQQPNKQNQAKPGNNHLKNEGMMQVLKQQQSKESLYNELLSSFDFSQR